MEKMLTLEEVSKLLDVSVSWLYRKCRAKILPNFRCGGVIRVKESELARWINEQSTKGCAKV